MTAPTTTTALARASRVAASWWIVATATTTTTVNTTVGVCHSQAGTCVAPCLAGVEVRSGADREMAGGAREGAALWWTSSTEAPLLGSRTRASGSR